LSHADEETHLKNNILPSSDASACRRPVRLHFKKKISTKAFISFVPSARSGLPVESDFKLPQNT